MLRSLQPHFEQQLPLPYRLGSANYVLPMKGLARDRRPLLCTLALCVLLLLAGCQSATAPTAAAPLPGEIMPLGLLETLSGNGSPGGSTSQGAAAPASNVADRYPIAKWFNNEQLIPSNDRDWVPEHKVLPTAEFGDGEKVTVHNVRNAQWLTAVDCIVERDDR